MNQHMPHPLYHIPFYFKMQRTKLFGQFIYSLSYNFNLFNKTIEYNRLIDNGFIRILILIIHDYPYCSKYMLQSILIL